MNGWVNFSPYGIRQEGPPDAPGPNGIATGNCQECDSPAIGWIFQNASGTWEPSCRAHVTWRFLLSNEEISPDLELEAEDERRYQKCLAEVRAEYDAEQARIRRAVAV